MKAKYERFDIRAGILEDKAHFAPRSAKKGLGTLQGGPVRKQRDKIYTTNADVSESLRKTHGVDYLRQPVQSDRTKDMLAFRRAMGDLLTGVNRNYSKVEALFRAVIRNPMLAGKYGRNTRKWAEVKTFNRKLFDTGQFFKGITAKVRSRVSK